MPNPNPNPNQNQDQDQNTHTEIDPSTQPDMHALKAWIVAQALDIGFSACGIARPDTRNQLAHLKAYLEKGHEGNMAFLHNHHDKRADPTLLVENTQSIISVRLDYLTQAPKKRTVADNASPNQAIIARYARGRDYHKTMRGMLKTLAKRIEAHLVAIGAAADFTWRPFADSAPIFEKTLAENAGLGWTGKNTLLINKKAGSFFVLGELFTSLPLPFDVPAVAKKHSIANNTLNSMLNNTPNNAANAEPTVHCGSCTACIDICPTQAIIAPYQLDATKCIAYQTIENKGKIPVALRKPIGNRVFGCDDCQLICPWNGFAKLTSLADFQPRHSLDKISLLEIWQWNEATFLANTAGSPLRRTGYHAFMRNVAVGLGNAPYADEIMTALTQRKHDFDDNVAEHIQWAITEQKKNLSKC